MVEEIPDSPDTPDSLQTKRRGLSWRLVLAMVALVMMAILVYPWVSKQFGSQSAAQVPVWTTVTDSANGPVATAQANPNSAQAQFEMGNVYVQANQWEQALVAYQKAVELDPKFQGAYANMGVVYYQLAQLDLAAAQYQKALELNPNDGEVAYNLGALYLQQALSKSNPPNQDLLNQAVNQLNHAAKLKSQLAEPYFSLGVAYSALNQKEAAIQAFETFLARDSGKDPRAGQEAQRYLESLRK